MVTGIRSKLHYNDNMHVIYVIRTFEQFLFIDAFRRVDEGTLRDLCNGVAFATF